MSHTLNHVPSLIAGQTLDARKFALDVATRFKDDTAEDVVKTAKRFEAFLLRSADAPEPVEGGTA